MAAPSYTTDLTPIITDMPNTTGWTSLTGASNTLSAPETDFYIQGNNCISKQANTSTGTRGMIYNSSQTISSGSAVYMWLEYLATAVLHNETNGGLQVLIGSSSSAYKHWYVKGADTYAYGGWFCAVVDPTTTADNTTGSPTSTTSYFGSIINLASAGPSKGNPFGIDAIRWGRTLTVTQGDTGGGGPATFSGIASTNDDINNRWGQFQAIDGGYLMQGRLLLGTTGGSSVYFVDSNKNITIADTKKVSSTFNQIEIQNSSSTVSWTNINIAALGTTSRGNFIVTDNATVNFSTCVFTGMGTFGFLTNSTITNSTFRRCNLVTRGGASISSCTFDSSNDSLGALSIANPSTSLTGCKFIKPASTNHAIIITATGTYTLANNSFTGYATNNGSTGNEVVYNNSGGAVTIQHSGTTGTISYRNGAGASTSVSSSVSITITVKDESGTTVGSAYVYIEETNTTTEVMNTTSNGSGIATGSYAGAESAGTLRVRKYGYKPFTGSVDLSSNISQGVTLVIDPVQDASPQDLSSYYTINTTNKTIASVGSATYTVKEYFKWLANVFAASSYMQYTYPMSASTSTVFNFTNSWTFGTPSTDFHYLKSGSISSSDENTLWANIYTIGTLVSGTTLDIYQNDSQITPWWASGHIDILVKIKDSGSLIDSGKLTVLARKYSTLYDFSVVTASSGNIPVPLAAFDDANNQTSSGTVSGYNDIAITFGYTSQDVDQNSTNEPYDVTINGAGRSVAQVYEYLKYITTHDSSTTFTGYGSIPGEYYQAVGDIRFDYDNEGGGGTAFSQGELITGTGGDSPTGYLVSLIDSGTTGTMVLRNVHGTFTNDQTITGGTTGRTAQVNGTPESIVPFKQSPFGTFAGGKFFGARGVYLTNVSDPNNYQLIDSTGTSRTPPITATTTITVKDLSTGLAVEGAHVLLWATNNDNYFYQDPVSITGSGTTATVTQTGHGLSTNDYVIIEGVTNDDDYNGVFQVTVTGNDTYTYTASETLGSSPATGSPTATFVFISSSTNASGIVSDSRVLTSNQPISGWIRKSSSSPYYQQGTVSGTIDSTSGFSVTVQLARDE